MNDYNNLKKEWKARILPESQKNGYKEVIQKGILIRRKQLISQIVLSITVVVLATFYYYISAYKNSQVSLGLMLMIGSLIVRVIIEVIFKYKTLNHHIAEEFTDFNNTVIKYYKSRLYIHYLITPVLFIVYIIGFTLLLPGFKESLSNGFYTYIIYSSWLIFGCLGILIFIQIKRELKNIKSLKIIDDE